MEIHDTIGSILERKEIHELWSAAPDQTVFEAIQEMSEKNIGALPVLDGEILVGIISERDYMSKVVVVGRSSKETAVREIMTTPVYCATPTMKITEALQLMTEKHIRHLPVTDEGKVTGIVSIGDLVRRMIASQGALIDQLEGYLSVTSPA